jgi:translation initiation factor 2 subunit 1
MMRYQREGFPEEDEIVLCTVKSVQYHSVFVSLDHYGGKTGLIHISEVSPGRIRNIRDFVVEDKKVLCKVLRIDQEKGHIDLSLRRVNEGQKRTKNDELKQEQRAENIIDVFAMQNKLEKDAAYNLIAKPILSEYTYVFEAFNEVVESDLDLSKLIKKEYVATLVSLIREKISEKTYDAGGVVNIKIFSEDGLETVKEALHRALSVDPRIIIKYLGGGSYSLKITAKENKEAESLLKDATDRAKAFVEEKKGSFEFTKA